MESDNELKYRLISNLLQGLQEFKAEGYDKVVVVGPDFKDQYQLAGLRTDVHPEIHVPHYIYSLDNVR